MAVAVAVREGGAALVAALDLGPAVRRHLERQPLRAQLEHLPEQVAAAVVAAAQAVEDLEASARILFRCERARPS